VVADTRRAVIVTERRCVPTVRYGPERIGGRTWSDVGKDAPTVVGAEDWSQSLADSIEDGCHVVVATADDAQGDAYAREIGETLAARVASGQIAASRWRPTPKRGRPPLGDAKREPVQVALSADERAELEAYAEREGETLAGAIRDAALRAARWRP
jgi:hypothetical protein